MSDKPKPPPKRPSDPGPTATLCRVCNRMADRIGITYGWGLCDCGSFRLPEKPSSAEGSP